MSPSAIAVVRVQAFPGQAAALGRYLGELLEQVRLQPGCQSGELQALAANRWQLSTCWSSQGALDAHLSSPKAQHWLSRLGCSELALGLEFESHSAG